MSFNWHDYYRLAIDHINISDASLREAAIRSAVSRTYYAAFISAREFARNRYNFKPTETGEDHKLVRIELSNHGLQDVSTYLNDMREWRNECDYKNDVPNLNTYVRSAFQRAELIFKKLT